MIVSRGGKARDVGVTRTKKKKDKTRKKKKNIKKTERPRHGAYRKSRVDRYWDRMPLWDNDATRDTEVDWR